MYMCLVCIHGPGAGGRPPGAGVDCASDSSIQELVAAALVLRAYVHACASKRVPRISSENKTR